MQDLHADAGSKANDRPKTHRPSEPSKDRPPLAQFDDGARAAAPYPAVAAVFPDQEWG